MTERRETDRTTLSTAGSDKAQDWSKGERIAKWLAAAGVCSRREAERLIEEGKVAVNGEVLTTPAHKVTGADKITVDGKRIGPPDKTRLFRYHKPKGLVTTNSDPEGRATVFEHLPKGLPRVVTVGRLDLNTEGLLLLTNDGELARALELPSTGLSRKYRARAYGDITQHQLDGLKEGITYEGIEYRSIHARLTRTVGDNNWIDMTLTEGKKREARRALESVGLRVNRLIRISYGPFELADLPEGEVAEVPAVELLGEFGEVIDRKRRPNPDTMPRLKPKPSASDKVRKRSNAKTPGGKVSNTKAPASHAASSKEAKSTKQKSARPAPDRSARRTGAGTGGPKRDRKHKS